MTKTFKMLIGDDTFVRERTVMNTLTMIISSISSFTKIKYSRSELNEQEIYICEQFPLPGFDRAEIKVVSNIDDMIKQANDSYDWIVTDLDYGAGYSDGGRIIINNIVNVDAVKAIFTAVRTKEKMPYYLDDLENVDYIIAPCLSGEKFKSKSELLGETIAKHYIERDE